MTSETNGKPAKETVGNAAAMLSAAAVRARTEALFDRSDRLDHFTLDMTRLDALADRVAEMLATTAGDAGAPFYACWRNFEAGGHDRWSMLGAYRQWGAVREMGRAAFDLAFVSAILGADPGADWRYREAATGEDYAGADGLAVAALAMFAGGLFSAKPTDPLRVDATALARLSDDEIATGLQHAAGNEVVGFAGRSALLRRLGEAVAMRDDLFASQDDPRPGGLFDFLLDEGQKGPITAGRILEAALDGLVPIWPDRAAIDDVPLGDTWAHPVLAQDAGLANGMALVPFHTMAQKLACSLVEPLIWAGVDVTDFNDLTGFADLEHGGLFIDAGVLVPRDAQASTVAHDAGALFVVEWRALTVALLERLADKVRASAELDADQLPLACVMKGGTLPLARKIALEKRGNDRPPLGLASDGTVI